ncbi:hypothetical protein HMPREF1991_02152, partial [Hoylesella loescheii DSM 19665 = JCM 12249 = ATCC 15930]
FYASKDRSMLIFRAKPSTTRPFCSKIEVAGRAYTRFWRKIQPVGVEIFQTNQVAQTF